MSLSPPQPPRQNPFASPQYPSQPPQLAPGAQPCAPCPHCGFSYAKPAGFTWWGGVLGPKLFNHVTCLQCHRGYNGKTGKSNDTAIAIYVGVGVLIGLVLGLALFAWKFMA
jgi:hypothetical protein